LQTGQVNWKPDDFHFQTNETAIALLQSA
jgi:hypothetical protein